MIPDLSRAGSSPGARCAVLGAGPIGLEAALEARAAGFDVEVYEAGAVGEHLRRFAHVRLFTPFGMNSTERGRELAARAGAAMAGEEDLVTAGELIEGYLEPLAGQLVGSGVAIHLGARVTHAGREGVSKASPVPDRGARAARPFVLRVERADGAPSIELADFVLDTSGVCGTSNPLGFGGVPTFGERGLGELLERHLPDVAGAARGRFAGRRVLLIGSGHSAATALVDFARAADSGAPADVWWIHRRREPIFREIEGDPLPARRELAARANEIAASAAWLRRLPGAHVFDLESAPEGGAVATVGLERAGAERIGVDRVLALVGYRPDLEMTRELRVHHCYESEGPMKLAAAIQAAAGAGDSDCLAQVSHGSATLETPEPGFFILGAKSYGRNPNFLLRIGHQQARDAVSLMAVARVGREGTMVATPDRKGADGCLETTAALKTTI